MDPSSAPSSLAIALQAALALAPSDQARLCALLQRLTNAPQEQAPHLLPGTELAPPAADPPAAVEVWLQDIALQPAWLRLQLLDQAIDSCDTDAERELLEAAQAQLLHAHPPLAVRRTVTELAILHPASTSFAVIGLLLGLTGLARLVLRGLF